ncbi:MAG: isoprenylcysteine carboxylmethyltransferase family protein [Acidobacteriia bacterium]|nr:isoprenylcysteine carboxylmethyltransferase family protein [Terriglobia bacterium]
MPLCRIGVVVFLFMHPSRQSLVVGGAVAALGALLRLWAAGHIDKGKSLATGGPYAMTRNPLYLGSLIMALGVLLAGQVYWLLLPFGILYIALYYPVMKKEEQDLLQGYGEGFLEYAGRVPRFFPNFKAAPIRSSSFLWSRVKRNREHRHLLVLALAEIFLIVRSFL